MTWMVRLATEFVDEFRGPPAPVQLELLAHARVIERFGPHTGRPRVDTLKGSRHSNMKELRFEVAAGSKAGVPEARFYRQLIGRADRRLSTHLGRLRSQVTRQ